MNKAPTSDDEVIERLHEIPTIVRERGRYYGHPSLNHGCTADMWSAWLNRRYGLSLRLDVRDVCEMNLLQKTSRQANTVTRDNDDDRIGYIVNAQMAATKDRT